jgi:hypothetical protein
LCVWDIGQVLGYLASALSGNQGTAPCSLCRYC